MDLDFLNPFKDGVPFHPALVHLPLGIAMLLPGLAFLATVALWRGWVHPRAWWVIVAIQATMVLGCMMAHETGEKEKTLVGGIVDDQPIQEHEDAANLFIQATTGTFVVSLATAFVSAPKAAMAMRLLVTALSLVLLALGALAGHKGGRLVYIHNAAEAHLPENSGGGDEKKPDQAEDGE